MRVALSTIVTLTALLLHPVVVEGHTSEADTSAAYEKLGLQVGATYNVNRNRLHDAWSPGVGPELTVTVPFYLGYAEAVAGYHIYDALPGADVPDFQALMIQAGWGLQWEATDRLAFSSGIRVGNYGMGFDTNGDLERAEVNESELIVALQSSAAVRLSEQIQVVATGSYQRTYTRIRMNLVYASVGIRYQIDTPSWLRSFLR